LGEEKTSNLTRFNRLLAVPTLIVLIIVVISGYGAANPAVVNELTGGLFPDRLFSLRVHMAVVLPALILLTIHLLIALRSALVRWGVRESNLLNAFLVLLGAFMIGYFALLQYLIP